MRASGAVRPYLHLSASSIAVRAGLLALGLALAGHAQEVAQNKGLDAERQVRVEQRLLGVPARTARSRRFLAGRVLAGAANAVPALGEARRQHLALLAQPRVASLAAPWASLGPAQVVSPVFGPLTGRVTALALDPADTTGNTLYVGTTGGGVWRSTNAQAAASAVWFTPLTDTLPVFSANAGSGAIASLSIGALAVGPGVVLAGTGDPNDATDSYYGQGILRSADGGTTWTLIQGSQDGVAGSHSFTGLAFAGFAVSSVDPRLWVAAVTQAVEGDLVNAADAANSVKGLYYSADAGATWHMSTLLDGAQVVQTPLPAGANNGGNAAVAVVWNRQRQRFYAAVRFHGFYESADGITWTRLTHQPGMGLTASACPPNQGAVGSGACPIFRAALAAEPVSGDLFALTVDSTNRDQGLYQDVCGLTAGACTTLVPAFAAALQAGPLETAGIIPQGDYDLVLAAVPRAGDTQLYVGTVDLYRCTLAGGCSLRNTTNAQNGCLNPAGVAPAQHALAALGDSVFTGNDGGLYRSTDAIAQTGSACALADAGHFQNLNPGFGSLAEVVSFAQDPASATTLLAGLGALGSAGTGSASAAEAWPQLAAGEGGTVAIDPAAPGNWYVSNGAGIHIARCINGAGCTAADFTQAIGPAQVAGDLAAVHAPFLLDPALPADVLLGTCRAWRGLATGGAAWSSANLLGRPFGAPAATGCSGTFPVVRSLGAGGVAGTSSAAQNAGSTVLYAGLAGTLDGGQAFGGHLFSTTAAQLATSATVWADLAKNSVTNDVASAGVFNPGGFDLSAVVPDPHDATGRTVYATVMGFAGNGTNAPHLYRSVDAGAHWTNISANLPNAPANAVVVDPNDANTLYVALDTGVYVTTTVTACASANCWSVFGSLLPNAPVVALAAAAGVPTGDGRLGVLRAGTYGRGIWSVPLLTATAPALPALSLNPSSLSFADQQVGTQSSPVTVSVTNTGTAVLNVTSVVTNPDFPATDTCVGAPVYQGQSCAVSLRFSPAATGLRTGVLTVYGNVAGGQATAALSGNGTAAAAIVLTPTALIFPSTTVGSTGATQFLTISNTGGTATRIAGMVASGDFVLTQNTCGSTLAPQAGCTVGIAFAPTAAGPRTGTLTVTDDAGVQVASLSGVATLPATAALSPLSLSFAAQQLNMASALQQVTLTNAGDQALTLIAAQIGTGDFTVVNGCGNSLNGHASCILSVAFVPKSLGAQAGTLVIADQLRSQTVALSGFGIAPPGVSLAPVPGLAFAATGVGLAAQTQTVTLTNNGGTPLSIAGIAVTGEFYMVPGLNTCVSALAPAAVCTVEIGFKPLAAGARTGTIAFTDNAGNSPQSLPLTGTGVDFTLSANGATTMTVASGGTATYTLLLRADAGVPGAAGFTCSGLPAHTLCTVNPAATALAGATAITVTLATGSSQVRLDRPPLPWDRSPGGPAAWALLLPAGWLLRRRRAARLAVVALLLSGCGAPRVIPGTTGTGGSAPVVTPAGSYGIVVAGSSTGLVRAVNLTLVVQ